MEASRGCDSFEAISMRFVMHARALGACKLAGRAAAHAAWCGLQAHTGQTGSALASFRALLAADYRRTRFARLLMRSGVFASLSAPWKLRPLLLSASEDATPSLAKLDHDRVRLQRAYHAPRIRFRLLGDVARAQHHDVLRLPAASTTRVTVSQQNEAARARE